MNFVDSKLHKTVYPRALLEIFIHYDESRNSLTKDFSLSFFTDVDDSDMMY
jgi:hypothetical protein